MLLKTSKGNTYTVEWIDTAITGGLYLQMKDDRSFSVIASEFEELAWLKREDENQGDKLFSGYSNLCTIKRVDGELILLMFEKGNEK